MNTCIALMGPTAAGKTDLAIQWSGKLPVSLISVDSALVYRGLNIGAGRPSAQELAAAPHALIDLREVWESYSAAEFAQDAKGLLDSAWAADRHPVLVGGTMLYFKALLEGISTLPAADPQVRQQLLEEAQNLGWDRLHAQLASVDPDAARRIHPNDPQRIQRALEVYRITGEAMTALQQRERPQALDAELLKIIWAPSDRQWLHDRIAVRFHRMLSAGLIDEVAELRKSEQVHADLPAMRSVGYRQVWEYLDGECTREEMIERAIAATRQLAKRQYTWLRKQKQCLWLDPREPRSVALAQESVEKFIS